LEVFLYLEHFANIADSESQPPTPPLLRAEAYCCAGAQLSDYIAQQYEHYAQGWFEMNPQNNPYYLFVTWEEYKYIQYGIKKKDMETYCDIMLKKENTPLRLPNFKKWGDIQQLVASMPDNQALGCAHCTVWRI
jgi:hypothetical protein